MHCVGLPTVLSRVRSQSSFGFPIAPQTIPSWILLLHMRSHPTGCRHLIVVVRPSCAPWFVSITPTSSCVGKAKRRDPVGTLRLNQARRGLCSVAETDAISIRNRFVSWFRCTANLNIVKLLQGCLLCLKEGNGEEEPVTPNRH